MHPGCARPTTVERRLCWSHPDRFSWKLTAEWVQAQKSVDVHVSAGSAVMHSSVTRGFCCAGEPGNRRLSWPVRSKNVPATCHRGSMGRMLQYTAHAAADTACRLPGHSVVWGVSVRVAALTDCHTGAPAACGASFHDCGSALRAAVDAAAPLNAGNLCMCLVLLRCDTSGFVGGTFLKHLLLPVDVLLHWLLPRLRCSCVCTVLVCLHCCCHTSVCCHGHAAAVQLHVEVTCKCVYVATIVAVGLMNVGCRHWLLVLVAGVAAAHTPQGNLQVPQQEPGRVVT